MGAEEREPEYAPFTPEILCVCKKTGSNFLTEKWKSNVVLQLEWLEF